MKKYLFIPVLILSLIFSQVASAQINFSDIGDDSLYKDAIDYFSAHGVIHGYPDGTFKPEQCVNRVELLKMLYLSLNENIAIEDLGLDGFSDTSKDEWYWPFIQHGLIKEDVVGYPDGTFRPGECVTRAEAIKLGVLGFNEGQMPESVLAEELPYDVNDAEQWWWEYMNYSFNADLLGTEHFDTFMVDEGEVYNYEPNDPMMRMEVAEMIHRIKVMMDNNLDQYDPAYSITSELNYYHSPTSGVSFLMPEGWEIVGDTNYGGEGNNDVGPTDYPTIVIQNPGSGGEIIINPGGEGECTGNCIEITPGFWVDIDDLTEEEQEALNKIILSIYVPDTFIPGITEFVNEAYDYSFEYPATLTVDSNEHGENPVEAYSIWVTDIDLNIEVQDPEIFADTAYGVNFAHNLEDFAEYIRNENIRIENENFPDKIIGELINTTVAGLDAYKFTLTDSFETIRGGYVLYFENTYIILNDGRYHYIIWYPSHVNAAKAAIETLEFNI
ncbi:S-layer homology domain-containing protein [Patescibacteria group bacterium]